jgi:ferredoxin
MKVTIDSQLCEGNGVCELVAPRYFEVIDDLAHLLGQTSDETDDAVLLRAASECPRLAILVETAAS